MKPMRSVQHLIVGLAIILIVVLGAGPPVWAQSHTQITLHNAATAAGDGAIVDTPYYSTVGVQITGTFTGEVTFKISTNGTDFVAVTCLNDVTLVNQQTATAASSWTCPVAGKAKFKAEITDYTNGSITVKALGTVAVSRGRGLPPVGSEGDCLLTSSSVWTAGACPGAGTGAPTDAPYLTTTAVPALTDEANLGALTTGLVKITVAAGTATPSTAAAGTDYVAPAGNVATATALAANGANCSAGSAPLGVDASGAAETCTNYQEEPGSNGLVAKTAANTSAARAITGTANQIVAGDGDGVAGNPTLSLSSTLVIPGPGIEFTETAGDSTCAAGNYWIKANSTTANFRKCQNGTASDLDTGGGGGGSAAGGANAVQGSDGAGTFIDTGCTATGGAMTCAGGFTSSGAGTGVVVMGEGTAPGAATNAGEHNLYFDSADSKLHSHENGGNAVAYARDVDNLSIFASTSSAQLAGVLSDETGSSGGFVRSTSPTIATPSFTGSPTLADGSTWTFNPSGTSAGLNVGAHTTDPSAPNNGDIWYDSVAGKFRCREAGATVDCLNVGAGSGDITDVNEGAGIDITNPGGAAGVVGPVAWDPATFVNNITMWNAANASRTWTANLSGGTDPVWTYSDGVANLSTGELQMGGNVVATGPNTLTLTNKTYNVESAGNAFTVKKYLWLPAGGCDNTTAGPIWNLPTTNAAVAACRTGTNTQRGVLEFADGSNLTAQTDVFLNEDWTGAIDATIVWNSATTGATSVVWQLAIACAGDGDSDDPAFTDDAFTADVAKGTANLMNNTVANTITTTGTCAAGDMAHIRVRRDSGHASDDFAGTARLIGVSLKIREAQ